MGKKSTVQIREFDRSSQCNVLLFNISSYFPEEQFRGNIYLFSNYFDKYFEKLDAGKYESDNQDRRKKDF